MVTFTSSRPLMRERGWKSSFCCILGKKKLKRTLIWYLSKNSTFFDGMAVILSAHFFHWKLIHLLEFSFASDSKSCSLFSWTSCRTFHGHPDWPTAVIATWWGRSQQESWPERFLGKKNFVLLWSCLAPTETFWVFRELFFLCQVRNQVLTVSQFLPFS